MLVFVVVLFLFAVVSLFCGHFVSLCCHCASLGGLFVLYLCRQINPSLNALKKGNIVKYLPDMVLKKGTDFK